MDPDPETDLTFTRTLAVPRALVFECWTSPEHLPHFFMPAPHSVRDVRVDLRPGGRFDMVMQVDGADIPSRGVWLEVVPDRRLVFTDAYSEGWRPAPDPFMTAILDFADAPGGGTLYTATARHRSPEARERHEAMGFLQGWGTVADQLEAYAKGLHG
ncbi:MAG: SRPBCC family protein [Hasllibacter sp.]